MAESVFSETIPELMTDHFRHLSEGSSISADVIKERGYRSLLGKSELEKLGFIRTQRRTPGILIPLWGVDGKEAGCQYRPDGPRLDTRGRPVKYGSPAGAGNRLDCPPRCQKMLGDPKTPLWSTEGSKKADSLASHGACAVSLTGVWGFKGKNHFGGITFLSDWDYIALKGRTVYLAFDSDIVTKDLVRKALEHIGEHLRRKGATIRVIQLPQLEGQNKTGIDDYLLHHTLQDAEKLVTDFKLEDVEDKERFVSGFVNSFSLATPKTRLIFDYRASNCGAVHDSLPQSLLTLPGFFGLPCPQGTFCFFQISPAGKRENNIAMFSNITKALFV